MRHRKKGRKLNRTASHRKALLRNLANQLFEHKEIKTTLAKAKEARSTVERLITYAKKGDLHHRRLAFSFLRQKSTIDTLFDEIAPTYTDRQGGYTRVIKLGRRQGDGASMSVLQLVGFETLAEPEKTEKDKKKKDPKVTEKKVTAKETKEIPEKAQKEKEEEIQEKEEEKTPPQPEVEEEKTSAESVEEEINSELPDKETPADESPDEENKEDKK